MASRFFSFREFDGRLNHILGKLGHLDKNEVVNELATEAESDILQELRDRVFTLAKDLYENKLRDSNTINEDEQIDISLQRRNKNGENDVLAKDIVDLYEYTVEISADFPKELLTRNSKLKEVKKKDEVEKKKDQVEEWRSLFSNSNKETVHQRIYNAEIMNMLKEQEKRIESLFNNAEKDRAIISDLQKDLTDAHKQIETLRNGKESEKDQSKVDTHKEGKGKEETTKPAQNLEPSPHSTKESTLYTTGQQGHSKSSPAMVTQMKDNLTGDTTTFLHKRGTPGSQPLEQYRKDMQQHNGRYNNKSSSETRMFRGAKREKGTNMYISGIEVDDETDEDIYLMIKDHAKQQGIRIMGHHIIRTKKYPYIVGCKIFMPENQQYIALNPDSWPEDIQCRKWEPAWKRNNGGYNNGYSEDKYWDGYEDRDRYGEGQRY